jgi:hypothetical protein
MVETCIGVEVNALPLETLPRMFTFVTGIYTDYRDSMLGALVMDPKLCCCLIGVVSGLTEEEAQDLVLAQEVLPEHLSALNEILEILSSAFFLACDSSHFRCRLYSVALAPNELEASVKSFMAAPPRHAGFQIEIPGYGEGTLVYISVDSVRLEDENE